MFAKRIVLVLVLLFTGASIASAQTPTPIQKFDAWVGLFLPVGCGQGLLCSLGAAKKDPANVDHGDNFFVVTKYPGQNVSLEPQAMMGFTLKDGSTIDVVVDGKSFPMYHKGKGGWLENAAQEPNAGRRHEGRSHHGSQGNLCPRHQNNSHLFADRYHGRAEQDQHLQMIQAFLASQTPAQAGFFAFRDLKISSPVRVALGASSVYKISINAYEGRP